MQIPLELDHATSFALEDYIVSVSNQLAHSMMQSWPDWSYHVVALVGPEASGKSHLAHGWAKNADAEIYDDGLIPEVDGNLACPNVVIEDIDPNAVSEERLFHLINWSKENSKNLLLTSRFPPNQWNIQLPDLRSRLSLVQLAEIAAPDDHLLMVLLAKMFSDRQLQVDLSLINYLLPRMERSFKAARELVIQMDAKALSRKKNISQKIAKECLQEMKML
jgi:chromosomal replication initiation ATPase DnaA